MITTPVLDDFEREAENPLSQGGAWSSTSLLSAPLSTDGHSAGGSGTTGYASHRVDTYSGPMQAWADFSGLGSEGEQGMLFACVDEEDENFYLALWEWDGLTLYRSDEAVWTEIASYVWAPLENGTLFGLDVSDGVVTGLQSEDGTNWTPVLSAEDSTYTEGAIGVGKGQAESVRIETFGGGPPVPLGNPTIKVFDGEAWVDREIRVLTG